jgi:hypothetical protein
VMKLEQLGEANADTMSAGEAGRFFGGRFRGGRRVA